MKLLIAPLPETETPQTDTLQKQTVYRFSQTYSTLSLCRGHPSKNPVSVANPAAVHGQVEQYLQKKLQKNIADITMEDWKRQRLWALTESEAKARAMPPAAGDVAPVVKDRITEGLD